jgi:3-hydroxyisobutyrate dehydrogenase-like beta-hydroxyacid dehydrogenase
MRIGFVGLGQMGLGMATRLIERGHELIVWNRTRAAAEALRARGVQVADDPARMLDAEVVVSMLADDVAVEAVWITSGLVQRIGSTALHLNMASVSLRMGQRLAGLHRTGGSAYVAAPVFGRPEFAAGGELDIVAAGAPDAIARCVPLFEALGRRWFNAGAEPHHANIVKIARNFLLASIIESLGEAFALVAKSGVEPKTLYDIITSTSMNAPAFKNYGGLMLSAPEKVTFPLWLGLKDVELALQAGSDTSVPMPVAEVIREQHLSAIAGGYGDKDWAALGNYIMDRAK